MTWSRHCWRNVPHHVLGDAVRLRTPERAEHSLDTDCSRPAGEGLAEAGVTVTEEEPRLLAPGRGLDELAPYPVGGGMSGHVQVNELAPTVLDEEEDVERLEGEGWHGEEVAGPNAWRVVLKEGAPGLGRRAAASLVHVPAYRFAADLVSQAKDLAADALGTPQ